MNVFIHSIIYLCIFAFFFTPSKQVESSQVSKLAEFYAYRDMTFYLKKNIEVLLEERVKEKLRKEEEIKSVVREIKKYSITQDDKYLEEIVSSVYENSKSPTLLLAIMCKESSFNCKAVSSSGCVGLGQIHPWWVSSLIEKGIISSKEDLFDVLPSVCAMEYVFNEHYVENNGNIENTLYSYLGAESKKYKSDIYRIFISLEINSKRQTISNG